VGRGEKEGVGGKRKKGGKKEGKRGSVRKPR